MAVRCVRCVRCVPPPQGCGHTFKTDASSGNGFTGFGYYFGGIWHPFTQPLHSMTGDQRAAQCHVSADRCHRGPGGGHDEQCQLSSGIGP